MREGAKMLADRRSGQRGLFGDAEESGPAASAQNLPNLPEFEERQRLAMEKEVLGFYLTSHPLAEFESTLSTYCSHSSSRLAGVEHRAEVIVGGMLAALKFSHTKNPRPGSTHTKYAMWDLEDLDGIVRCILWPESFAEFGQLVQADAILAMRAQIDRRPGSEEVNLIVQELFPLAELPARFASGVSIRVREDMHGEEALGKLREIVRGYPGPKPLRLHLALADGGAVTIECAGGGVALNPELRRRVDDLLGPGNFKLIAGAPRPTVTAPAPSQARRRELARN
jgi:DNA polymerase-3 subunit alpha